MKWRLGPQKSADREAKPVIWGADLERGRVTLKDKGPVDPSMVHTHAPGSETPLSSDGKERLVEVQGAQPRAASSLRCCGDVSRNACHLRKVGAAD